MTLPCFTSFSVLLPTSLAISLQCSAILAFICRMTHRFSPHLRKSLSKGTDTDVPYSVTRAWTQSQPCRTHAQCCFLSGLLGLLQLHALGSPQGKGVTD